MERVVSVLAVLVLALALVGVASPAQSSSRSSGFPWRAVITFDKNWHNQFDSLVTWRLYQRSAGTWKVVETTSWRAGAGLPGSIGRSSCATSKGWLPDGTYRLRQYDDYAGHVIKGRAFRLDDKACPSGHVRHDLFLHTEQGPHSRQCADRRGDQPCRWEWPRINDYRSYGCIKMAPGDLAELTDLFHRHFGAGIRYPADRVALRVVS